MSRSPEIPIVLWVCAAICAHFMMGGGTEEVSKQLHKVTDDHRYISMLGAEARERTIASEQQFDIALVGEGAKPQDEEPPKTEDDIQRDLKALFAIRDAAIADTAPKRPRRPEGGDFQATQPSGDGVKK